MPQLTVNPEMRPAIERRIIDLQRRLDDERRKLHRRPVITTAQADRIADIEDRLAQAKADLREIERYEAGQLRLREAPIEQLLEIVALPLLADVMNDFTAGIDSMLRAHGLPNSVFAERVAVIRREAMAIIDSLAKSEAGLPDLLTVDDTLVDAIRRKLLSFIRRRLNITPQ